MRARKPLTVPQFGVIAGGRLHGWRFRFLYFRVSVLGPAGVTGWVLYDLQVVARCSAPNWPFPCEIPLTHEHFMQLRAVPGERAKRLLATPLICSAYELAGLHWPYWLADPKPPTVRASVKRARGRPTQTIA